MIFSTKLSSLPFTSLSCFHLRRKPPFPGYEDTELPAAFGQGGFDPEHHELWLVQLPSDVGLLSFFFISRSDMHMVQQPVLVPVWLWCMKASAWRRYLWNWGHWATIP